MEIAKKIVQSDTDNCLAVKGNQPTLHQEIATFLNELLEEYFADAKAWRYGTTGKGHGKEENRYYYLCPFLTTYQTGLVWPS